MKRLFVRFVLTVLVLFIVSIVALHILSQTPESKVPGLIPLHLLPSRGFSCAIIFSRENILKKFWQQDSVSDTFYLYTSSFLQKSYYSARYSMVIKNAIGKYVVFAKYNDGSFLLVTKPRFRMKLLRNFLNAEKKDYDGITTYKIQNLYFYFVEDYFVITPNLELLKLSLDIATGKRMGSLYDDTGDIDNYDLTLIFEIKDSLLVLKPVVFGISPNRLFLKGKPKSSVIFDAMKKGKLPDSLPTNSIFLGIKIPYMELYDAYVSHYQNDELGLAATLWDIGGNGFVWWDGKDGFLFSLSSREAEERLISDIFNYLKLKNKADSMQKDLSLHLYIFFKNGNPSYFLKYINGVNENRFVFCNKKTFLDDFLTHKYTNDDGFLNLTENLPRFYPIHSYLHSLINWYMKEDSLENTQWKLSIKEYRTSIYIEGKRNKN